jgi:tetratricopeptide (TPR) repeat protein
MYAQAARQFPNNIDLLSDVAEHLAEVGAKDQAKTLMKKVVAIEPKSGGRATENAAVLIMCRDYDAAYSEAQRGLSLDHSQLGYVINVQATALNLAGKASEGVKLIRSHLNDPSISQGDKALLRMLAGIMLGELNQNDEALNEFKAASELVVPTEALYSDLTAIGPWWIYSQMKEPAKAAQAIANDNPNQQKNQWPNSVLRFLRGELTTQDLESLGQRKITKTDIEAIVGLKASLNGNDAEAERCFHWNESNGNPFSNWYMPLHGVYLRNHGHPQQ